MEYIDGLVVQYCSTSSALAMMELLQSCTKPSTLSASHKICTHYYCALFCWVNEWWWDLFTIAYDCPCAIKVRASHHWADGRLTAGYREVSEAARLWFRLFQSLWNSTGTSAAALYRDACQISELYDHYNIESRGSETSRDLAVRRLIA